MAARKSKGPDRMEAGMTRRPIAVGRFARLTAHPRTDAIGKVTRSDAHWVTVTVPGWKADGYPAEFTVRHDEIERSTAEACDMAARDRGWPDWRNYLGWNWRG